MVFLCALAVLQASAVAPSVEAFRRATVARDYAWFERNLAPDYLKTLGTTKIGRAASLAQLRGGLAKSPVASLSAKILKSKPDGKGLLVTVAFVGTMRGVYQGRPATITATWKDDQSWTKSKGRWLLRSTRTYAFDRTADVR